MRIVIDGRMYHQSGVGRYIRNLIFHLQKIDKINEYTILLNSSDYETLICQNKNFKKVLANFGWYGIKEQIELPRILNKINADLVHLPHFNAPLFYKGRYIITIHDLIHQHFQMKRATTHDPLTFQIKQFGYKQVFKTAVLRSLKIITVSNFVKSQLIAEASAEQKKITVTYEAVDDNILLLNKNMTQDKSEKILNQLNIKKPYIFYIGNAHPHKNIEGLIRAFLKLRKNYHYLSLVLAGGEHYFWQKIKNEFKHPDINYLGYITDEHLVALYKEAKVFVLPSFEEGFGIPILEAMACGCPVAASNIASIPEVGSDAAVYFDPKSKEDMTEKISVLLSNDKLRKVLIEKGKKRYKLFSWEKLAKQTLEVYQDACSNSA